VLFVLSTCVLFQPARADQPPTLSAIDLDQVGSGELLWKSERGLVPLPIADVEVELFVTGIMTRGRLTQRFHNPTTEVIEAIFVFPMPDRSAVHHMEMRVGDRRIVSTIREKEEARRTYEAARETGRKATLVDQQRPNLFTTSIANINPEETITVVLEYFEEVDYRDGQFGLRFPLTFTPRFAPPQMTAPSEKARESEPGGLDGTAALPLASIRVLLHPGFRLDAVTSESHSIQFAQEGDALRIVTRDRNIVADRDFLLSWSPEPGDRPQTAVFVEERQGERFALVMVLPPAPESDTGVGLPTETLFIVDVSGSMAGPSIEQARIALRAALDRLRPDDRFNILIFNDDSRLLDPEFRNAERETLETAREWVAGLRATGGTMIYPALMRGLALMGESRSAHAQRIIFLTDGAVANEQEVIRALAEHLGEVRLHTIGIGHAPNAYLMRKMARFGHGLCDFVANTAQAENRISTFFERLDRPVMEKVQLDTTATGLDEVYPGAIPDLYAGEPLLLSAKLNGEDKSAALSIGGYTRVGWLETKVDLDDPVPRDSGISLRWARARVGSLMDSLHEGADPGDVRNEVVELGLGFNLVTRYTSLVAVEERPSALGPARTTRMAAALPVGGTDNPLKRLAGVVLAGIGLLVLMLVRARVFR
jgi:Ca-activated chloride channel family protein